MNISIPEKSLFQDFKDKIKLMCQNSPAYSFRSVEGLRQISKLEQYYKIEQVIGQGSFGTVHRAVQINSGKTCAIKVISKHRIVNDSQYLQMLNELKILRSI